MEKETFWVFMCYITGNWKPARLVSIPVCHNVKLCPVPHSASEQHEEVACEKSCSVLCLKSTYLHSELQLCSAHMLWCPSHTWPLASMARLSLSFSTWCPRWLSLKYKGLSSLSYVKALGGVQEVTFSLMCHPSKASDTEVEDVLLH